VGQQPFNRKATAFSQQQEKKEEKNEEDTPQAITATNRDPRCDQSVRAVPINPS
jgi:hypothetical protein